MDAAGGGGYGDPKERDIDDLLNDVLDGYISKKSATQDYGEKITHELLRDYRQQR
jgi:N-methylhydantoinase B